jgi:hypothetical protein
VGDGRPVDDLRDGLAHRGPPGPRVLGVEDQVADLRTRRLHQLEVVLAPPFLEVDDVLGREPPERDVDLPVLQRGDHLVGALEVPDGDGAVLAVGGTLVVVVADEPGLLPLLVGAQAVRSRSGDLTALTQGVGRVLLGVDDRHGRCREHEREGGVRLVEAEDDLPVALRLDPLQAAEQTRRAAVHGDLPDAVDGVLDGSGVEPVPVREGHPVAQCAAVRAVGVVGEAAALGGVGLGLGRPGGIAEEGLVDVAEQLPGAVPRRGGVQGAGCAGGAHDDRAVLLGRVRGEHSAPRHQGYGRDRRQIPQRPVPFQHAHAPR